MQNSTMKVDRLQKKFNHKEAWLTVIIVAFERYDLLSDNLSALLKQDDSAFEVIIVDNTSAALRQPVELPDERFQLVVSDVNLGFAGGVNCGLDQVRTLWTATLNPDAIPRQNWISALRTATKQYPDVALFGSKQLMKNNPELLDGFGDVYSIYGIPWRGGYGQPASLAKNDIEVLAPCAAAALYRTDILRAMGGFDERFFCYLEDIDVGIRAHAFGQRVIQIANAIVVHASGEITGPNSPFTLYHSYRNRIWLFAKTIPWVLLFVALPLFIAANAWLLMRTAKVQPLAPRLRGVRDGFLGVLPFLRRKEGSGFPQRMSATYAARILVWNPVSVRQRLIVSVDPAEK